MEQTVTDLLSLLACQLMFETENKCITGTAVKAYLYFNQWCRSHSLQNTSYSLNFWWDEELSQA